MEWKYGNYMKNIFQSIGLDHYYYGNFTTNIFKHFFGKAVQDKELSRRLEMSSLSSYNTFNISPYVVWTRTIRRNRDSNKIVLTGSRDFRFTTLSKAAVLDRRLLS